MKRLLLGLLVICTVLTLSACAAQVKGKHLGIIDGAVDVYEDEERSVVCWVVRGTSGVAIDCKSQNELTPAKKPAAP